MWGYSYEDNRQTKTEDSTDGCCCGGMPCAGDRGQFCCIHESELSERCSEQPGQGYD